MIAAWQKLWRAIREVFGDAAYDRYLESQARRGSARALSRAEFYVESLERRYSRVNRCC